MPLSPQSSIGAGLIVNATDLSAFFTEINPECQVAMLDTTVLPNSAPTFQPGLTSGQLAAVGIFDGAVAGSDTILAPLVGSATIPLVLGAPKGFATIGNRVSILQAHQEKYGIAVKMGDLIRNSAQFRSNNGFDFGVLLHALAAELTSTNSASVDNGASSANGGVAQIHATAITSNPSVVVKVQHSTNNSTWVDLVTFTALAAVGQERIAVAPGTTVNQYLRAISTFTGGTSPSLTYAVGFARR
jgi:hypothetical protein